MLFAIFVVVPLQSYAELWHKVDYRGDFLTFYVERYLTFGNLAPIYGPEAAGFYLPTYNHMWFVLYAGLRAGGGHHAGRSAAPAHAGLRALDGGRWRLGLPDHAGGGWA